MENQKAPKKTWFQSRTTNGQSFVIRSALQKDQPSKQNTKVETSDRTNQVLRHIYPINNSGSKQIIIGSDPEADFKAVIAIRKPGFKGVVLSHEGSAKMVAEIHAIRAAFFDSHTTNFELGTGEKIEFGTFMSHKSVFIKKDLGETKYANIILNAITFLYLVDIADLLKYAFDQITSSASDIKKMHDAMMARVQQEAEGKSDFDKKLFVKTLSPCQIDLELTASIDFCRLFLELRKVCELELPA